MEEGHRQQTNTLHRQHQDNIQSMKDLLNNELRMRSEEDMRREQMERGQPGVQPVGGKSPQSGPSRGLFSNRAAGEATSGIDNIMDPTMLTIIGIALTVFTTGMTLFRGN